jgi:hypothetical protein
MFVTSERPDRFWGRHTLVLHWPKGLFRRVSSNKYGRLIDTSL